MTPKPARATRRSVVKAGGAGLLAVPALGAAVASQRTVAVASQETIELRMAWWGGDARHEMMNSLLDLYEERNPTITIAREFTDDAPYWDRLTTQVASGNAPDLIHMRAPYASLFARRDIMLDLAPLTSDGSLNLEDFDPIIVENGRVDGTHYYVSVGNSGPSLFYNTVLLEEAGLEAPASTWTWDDFVATATDATNTLGEDIYGCSDVAGSMDMFRVFLRQRGKEFVTGNEDGTAALAFETQDLLDWLTLWEGLRQAGAVPPMDVTLEATGTDQSLLATRRSVMHMTNGNQLKIFQRFLDDPLSIVTVPNGPEGSEYGNFIVFASIGISATTQYPTESARVIDFMVNDPDAAKLYMAEHGPPGSAAMREVVLPLLTPSDEQVFEFVQSVIDTSPVPPPQNPDEFVELQELLTRTNQDVAYGSKSVDDATADFMSEAESALD